MGWKRLFLPTGWLSYILLSPTDSWGLEDTQVCLHKPHLVTFNRTIALFFQPFLPVSSNPGQSVLFYRDKCCHCMNPHTYLPVGDIVGVVAATARSTCRHALSVSRTSVSICEDVGRPHESVTVIGLCLPDVA